MLDRVNGRNDLVQLLVDDGRRATMVPDRIPVDRDLRNLRVDRGRVIFDLGQDRLLTRQGKLIPVR